MVVVGWIDDDDDDDDDDDGDDGDGGDDDDDTDVGDVVFFLWCVTPGITVGGAIFSNMNRAQSQTTKSPVCSGSQPRLLCCPTLGISSLAAVGSCPQAHNFP